MTARERAIETLKKELTDDEKPFLVSVKSGQPNWSVMGIEGIEKLSAGQKFKVPWFSHRVALTMKEVTVKRERLFCHDLLELLSDHRLEAA